MPDRADYLARTLLTRMRSLEEVLADDDEGAGTHTQRRVALVEKVMAVEAGVLDGTMHRTFLAAMPTVTPGKPIADRDLKEFSAFLRERLPSET